MEAWNRVGIKREVEFIRVIPGRAEREPGIHNHDREYGFPDVQLHI
jgi:hypothetical protein